MLENLIRNIFLEIDGCFKKSLLIYREGRVCGAFCRKLGKAGPLNLNYGKSAIKAARELGHLWRDAVYWKEVAGRVTCMSPKLPTHGA